MKASQAWPTELSMVDAKQRERPSVTVDIVVVAPAAARPEPAYGLLSGRLWVLLVQRKRAPFEGQWAIPGGFVEPDETLAQAARRELREETGLEPERLEQLHTFGAPGRDPRGWTISVAHLALLSAEQAAVWRPQAGSDAGAVGWFDLEHPPDLAFDHARILACAVGRLLGPRG
jgi:8-oxo-dGTP diphosphatase